VLTTPSSAAAATLASGLRDDISAVFTDASFASYGTIAALSVASSSSATAPTASPTASPTTVAPTPSPATASPTASPSTAPAPALTTTAPTTANSMPVALSAVVNGSAGATSFGQLLGALLGFVLFACVAV
jgi:hypothetical protein